MKDLWLVSGNPFDVTGARHSGMNAIWVDRAGNGWVDRFGREGEGTIRYSEEFGGDTGGDREAFEVTRQHEHIARLVETPASVRLVRYLQGEYEYTCQIS